MLLICLANLPLLRVHAARVNVSRNALFNLHSEKKHFLWRWYCGKEQIEMWFIMVYTLIANEYASLLFSQTMFSFCFLLLLHVERVCKSFWQESWRVQVAHLHKAARALSRRSRCFQLSTNLKAKISFVIFNVVV